MIVSAMPLRAWFGPACMWRLALVIGMHGYPLVVGKAACAWQATSSRGFEAWLIETLDERFTLAVEYDR